VPPSATASNASRTTSRLPGPTSTTSKPRPPVRRAADGPRRSFEASDDGVRAAVLRGGAARGDRVRARDSPRAAGSRQPDRELPAGPRPTQKKESPRPARSAAAPWPRSRAAPRRRRPRRRRRPARAPCPGRGLPAGIRTSSAKPPGSSRERRHSAQWTNLPARHASHARQGRGGAARGGPPDGTARPRPRTRPRRRPRGRERCPPCRGRTSRAGPSRRCRRPACASRPRRGPATAPGPRRPRRLPTRSPGRPS
jgi:hypothetical protein